MHAGTESDDASLIEASRGGDRTAFAQIIERHYRAVYAVAYSGVRDHARAEDITQDTFVLAWRRLDDLRDSERLAAWLCGIARNLARNVRRQLHRETLGDSFDVVDATTPYEVLTDAESERLIAAGLAEVPDVYREPLVLFYYQDRSVEDVARALGITPATTNKRLSRGRRFLAERVATIVENGLARRGPSPALAGAIVAAIALLPAAHVDASPLVKGSTMSKIAIAAAVTVVVGGGALVAATTMSGTTAHAQSTKTSAPSSDHCLADFMQRAASAKHRSSSTKTAALHAPAAPTLAANTTTSTSQPNDCATVGRHLAELEADATYGPEKRPDEATCEKCAGHYTTMCEAQGWSAERRACSLAAADLINAHLCAGGNAGTPASPSTTLAPALQCTPLGKHIADTVQAGGLYKEVTDMAQQVDSACQLGGWSVELRQCFAAASTIPALQACIAPNEHE